MEQGNDPKKACTEPVHTLRKNVRSVGIGGGVDAASNLVFHFLPYFQA
jgi:hypothetical protein